MGSHTNIPISPSMKQMFDQCKATTRFEIKKNLFITEQFKEQITTIKEPNESKQNKWPISQPYRHQEIGSSKYCD